MHLQTEITQTAAELLRVAIDIMKRGIIDDETCASKSAKLQNSAFYLRRRKS